MTLCKLNNVNSIWSKDRAVESMTMWPLEGLDDAYESKPEKLDHVLYLKQVSNIQLTLLKQQVLQQILQLLC